MPFLGEADLPKAARGTYEGEEATPMGKHHCGTPANRQTAPLSLGCVCVQMTRSRLQSRVLRPQEPATEVKVGHIHMLLLMLWVSDPLWVVLSDPFEVLVLPVSSV